MHRKGSSLPDQEANVEWRRWYEDKLGLRFDAPHVQDGTEKYAQAFRVKGVEVSELVDTPVCRVAYLEDAEGTRSTSIRSRSRTKVMLTVNLPRLLWYVKAIDESAAS